MRINAKYRTSKLGKSTLNIVGLSAFPLLLKVGISRPVSRSCHVLIPVAIGLVVGGGHATSAC